MQYRTALLSAARVQLVACVGAALVVWGLCGCGKAATPKPRPASPELSYFAFEPAENPQLKAAAVGQITGYEISVDVPFGSVVTALVPRIEQSGVRSEPRSGVPQDFSEPVDYVVTAQDGSEATYSVTVNVLSELTQPGMHDAGPALDSSKAITLFSIAGIAANIAADSIELTVPHDTRLRNITPELEYRGATISPKPLDPQDFTQPVVYVVTAQDGSTRSYTVRVSVAANTSKAITHFRVFGIESAITGDSIALILPAGADVTMLVPAITLSGGTVMPPSGQTQDFSKPVLYTVTSVDGSTQTYTVVVSLAAGSANDIVSFEVPSVLTTIRGDEIQLHAPHGADNCNWAPTIVHSGASIEPASGQVQDFRPGVSYIVTAADGSQRHYTVTCEIANSSARGIASFEVQGLAATIIGDDITLTIPNGTSLGSLAPNIVHYGVRVNPASGAAQNFYAPVTYTLLELNGDKHTYTVKIVNADRSDNELVDLVFAGRHAHIDGSSVSLTLPAGSDVQALMPSLLHRGARTLPSGVARDFSVPQIYGVIARDATRRDYAVSVRVAGASDKALEDFALLSTSARITGTQISLLMPAGSDLKTLAPSRLQHTGVSVMPNAETPQDFTQPVSYVVTALDGSTQTYVVHASVAESSANQLTGLRLLGMDAEVGATQVELSLPAGTNLKALVPTLQSSGQDIQPLSSLPQDFSEPVSYTVTAADGSTRRYKVAITLLP